MSEKHHRKQKGIAAALQLLERPADPGYIDEWTQRMAKAPHQDLAGGISVVIFRLGKEWLAISGKCFVEVISHRPIHRIPHRTNAVLSGLVNFQGMLTICVNMHTFLEIDCSDDQDGGLSKHPKFKRMVAIAKDHELWVFPVDDIYGVVSFKSSSLGNIPVTLSKSTVNYLRGMIQWDTRDVGYLDEELLFFGLKRNVL